MPASGNAVAGGAVGAAERRRPSILELRCTTGPNRQPLGNASLPLSIVGADGELYRLREPIEWAAPAYSDLGKIERYTDLARRRWAREQDERAEELADEAWGGELVLNLQQAAHGVQPVAHVRAYHEHLRRSARWHFGRAAGQRERFRDVQHCGAGHVEITCQECGSVHEGHTSCGVIRVCIPCRDKRAQMGRAVAWRARGRILDELDRVGMLSPGRPGGRWSEKHFVLTLPLSEIGGTDAVERRIDLLFRAWRRFSKSLNRQLRRWHLSQCTQSELAALRLLRGPKGYIPSQFAYRCFEWTPAFDGQGHPHFHVWCVAPFLGPPRRRSGASVGHPELYTTWSKPGRSGGRIGTRHTRTRWSAPGPKVEQRRWLVNLWASALRSVALDVAGEDLVEFVGEVKTERIEREILKGDKSLKRETLRLVRAPDNHPIGYLEPWAICESKPGEPTASVRTMARVYLALEARRLRQVSAGFAALGRQPAECKDCGAVGRFAVEVTTYQQLAAAGLLRVDAPGVKAVDLGRAREPPAAAAC